MTNFSIYYHFHACIGSVFGGPCTESLSCLTKALEFLARYLVSSKFAVPDRNPGAGHGTAVCNLRLPSTFSINSSFTHGRVVIRITLAIRFFRQKSGF